MELGDEKGWFPLYLSAHECKKPPCTFSKVFKVHEISMLYQSSYCLKFGFPGNVFPKPISLVAAFLVLRDIN